jgi:hypothetical protein
MARETNYEGEQMNPVFWFGVICITFLVVSIVLLVDSLLLGFAFSRELRHEVADIVELVCGLVS